MSRSRQPEPPPALDHLVWAMPDLASGSRMLADAIGVEPLPGGAHPGMGTHNAILPLCSGTAGGAPDAYLELIAPDPSQPDPAGARPFGVDALEGPRLVTWAVRTRDLDAAARGAREDGFDPGILLDMSRARPDGTRIEWRLSLDLDGTGDGVVPLLIDWGDSPHPSRPDGGSTEAVGVVSLVAFEATHPNPAEVGRALAALRVDVPVGSGSSAGLRAVVRGPGGELVLN